MAKKVTNNTYYSDSSVWYVQNPDSGVFRLPEMGGGRMSYSKADLVEIANLLQFVIADQED